MVSYLFDYANLTCEPISKKLLRGYGSGNSCYRKSYTDGKLIIHGGRSVLNLQSQPYRAVFIDEVDSLISEIEGHGDPVHLAEIRLSSYVGRKILIAFGHPSTEDKGAGKLYYRLSDQRRSFIDCPYCSNEFHLTWDHIIYDNEMDSKTYRYVTPCCEEKLTNQQRAKAIRETCRQQSTLPEEEGDGKSWIGLHFSQLCAPNISIQELASRKIEALGDESVNIVFVNKRLGDVYKPKILEVSTTSWKEIINPNYSRGFVPLEAQILTLGQDVSSTKIHWSVWAWGYIDIESGIKDLMAWLIDYGEFVRPDPQIPLESSEFHQLNDLYNLSFPRVENDQNVSGLHVNQGLHDSGWMPTPVYEYCRHFSGRAYPCKGVGNDSLSTSPLIKWLPAPKYQIKGREVKDSNLKICYINTHQAKNTFFGYVGRKISLSMKGRDDLINTEVNKINLPSNVTDDFLRESTNERLTLDGKKYVWKTTGANHYLDCNIYAFAAAMNYLPFLQGKRVDPRALSEGKKQKMGHYLSRKRGNFLRGRREKRKW